MVNQSVINKVAILLLDYIVELPATIRQLASEDADVMFNKSPHGLSTRELVSEISGLQGKGLIYIEGDNGASFRLHEGDDVSSEILDLKVCLSAAGGKLWESAFKPDWNRFLSVDMEITDSGSEVFRLGALNKALLEEIREQLRKLAEVHHIEGVTSWRATYWKQFERGYQLEFSVKKLEIDSLLVKSRKQWCLDWSGLG